MSLSEFIRTRKVEAGLLGLVGIALASLPLLLLNRPEPPTYISHYTYSTPAPPTAVLFVGDSYTAATNSYATQACNALGWACTIDAQGATGYQNDGHDYRATNQPYIGRLPGIASNIRADLIFITGGRNDGEKIGPASLEYFNAVRAAYPKAKIFALEPFWNSTPAPGSFQVQREAVHRSAKTAGIGWIETDGWLNQRLIGPDNVHPTEEGQQVLASRVIRAVTGLRLSPGPSASASPAAQAAS